MLCYVAAALQSIYFCLINDFKYFILFLLLSIYNSDVDSLFAIIIVVSVYVLIVAIITCLI